MLGTQNLLIGFKLNLYTSLKGVSRAYIPIFEWIKVFIKLLEI